MRRRNPARRWFNVEFIQICWKNNSLIIQTGESSVKFLELTFWKEKRLKNNLGILQLQRISDRFDVITLPPTPPFTGRGVSVYYNSR